MAIKKKSEANVRLLTKRGRNSISLTLPFEMVKKLKWKKNQKVMVKMGKGSMVIKEWKKK